MSWIRRSDRNPTLATSSPRTPTTPALADAVQAAMLKIKADGRLAALQKKWFGAAFDTPDAVTDPAL